MYDSFRVAFHVWGLACKSTGINVCPRDMGIEKWNFVIFALGYACFRTSAVMVVVLRAARPRFTFSRISEALAVQINGLGSLWCCSTETMIVVTSSLTL